MIAPLLQLLLAGPSRSRTLVTSSLWSLPLRVIGSVATFLVGVQLAHYLQPQGLGAYGVILAIVTILGSIAQFGLPFLALREVAVAYGKSDHSALNGAIRWFAAASAGASLLVGAGFVLFSHLAEIVTPDFRDASWWGAGLILATGLCALVSAYLRGVDRMLAGQAMDIVVRPLLFCGLLMASASFLDRVDWVDAMIANFVAVSLTCFIGGWWLIYAVPRDVWRSPAPHQGGAWARAALPLWATDILRQFDSVYPVLVMGAVTTAAMTGVFRVAASCAVIVATPLTIFHVVLAPTLARFHAEGEKDKLQLILGVAAAVMFTSAVAVTAMVAYAGRWFIVAVFGAEYAGAYFPLVLLSVAQIVNGYFGVSWVLLAMSGREKDLLYAYTISVGVSVAAAFPLVMAFGGEGAAAAAILGALINNGMAAVLVKRAFGLDSSLMACRKLIRGAASRSA
jgi:O-antigen/teichoic acid export membrane protein